MKILYKLAKYLIILVVMVILADIILVLGIGNTKREFDHADSAIILGAAINTPALYNRSLTGLKLYQEGKVDQLVYSGGKIAEPDISEAEYMKQVVKSQNFSSEPVKYILEEESHNTLENIRNSKSLLPPETKSVVIVSDEFHLARAVLLAKRAGFDDVYWKAPEPTYFSKEKLRFYYLREFVAMIKYIPDFVGGV